MYFKGFGAIGVVDMMDVLMKTLNDRLKTGALGHLACVALSVCALSLGALYAAAESTSNQNSTGLDSTALDSARVDSGGESSALESTTTDSGTTDSSTMDSAPESSPAAQSEQERKKQLYFLRAQYYEHLRKLAQQSENTSRNGAFLGVVLGAGDMEITLDRGGRRYPVSISPFALGLSGGYTRFIGASPIGMRVYGQYISGFGSSNNIGDSVQTHLVSFNLDVVGDLAITDDGYYLGAYAGVGGGLQVFMQRPQGAPESSTRVVVGSVMNFGLSATLAHHHRLEAGVKIPPSAFSEDFKLKFMYLVGYEYLF